MINEVLPIDGWKSCGIDIIPQGCVVKYKFGDPVFLHCPHDRQPGPTIHRRYTVKVRDLPLGIHRSTLEVEVLECWCPKCRCFHSVRPGALLGTKGMTWRLMWHISWLVKEGSVADVARSLGIPAKTVSRANKAVLEVIDFLTPVKLDNLDAIVVDEKYLGRKRKFVTCVVDGYTGELLWMAEGKGSASLDGFYAMLTEDELEDIKVVSVDRGNAYVKAVREHLPHAELSFDPLHVIKNINDAVTEVRRDQYAKAEKEHKGIIKGMRYALLKAPGNLLGRQCPRLETLLAMNAPINTACVLKEQAREMYKLYYLSDAVPALQEWLELARQSGLKPFQRLAKGMARDAGYILNYFRYKLTSGRIEGVNSVIARVLPKTRGVGSVDYLRLMLRLHLNRLMNLLLFC